MLQERSNSINGRPNILLPSAVQCMMCQFFYTTYMSQLLQLQLQHSQRSAFICCSVLLVPSSRLLLFSKNRSRRMHLKSMRWLSQSDCICFVERASKGYASSSWRSVAPVTRQINTDISFMHHLFAFHDSSPHCSHMCKLQAETCMYEERHLGHEFHRPDCQMKLGASSWSSRQE